MLRYSYFAAESDVDAVTDKVKSHLSAVADATDSPTRFAPEVTITTRREPGVAGVLVTGVLARPLARDEDRPDFPGRP